MTIDSNGSNLNCEFPKFLPKEDLSIGIPDVLQKRMNDVILQTFQGMREMGIPNSISSKVTICFNVHSIVPDPNVHKKDDNLILEIPLLFLIKPADFSPNSQLDLWIKNRFDSSKLLENDIKFLGIFQIFMKNPVLAKKAKKFVLYHELAHVLLGHLSNPYHDSSESKLREKQADLTSATVSGEAEGGIYLFTLMSKYKFNKPDTTHPSYPERIAYLQKFKEGSSSYFYSK